MSKKLKAVSDDGDTSLRSIAFAMDKLSCGRVKIYQLVKSGRLEMVKLDGRSRITDRSLRRLIAELIERRTAPPAA